MSDKKKKNVVKINEEKICKTDNMPEDYYDPYFEQVHKDKIPPTHKIHLKDNYHLDYLYKECVYDIDVINRYYDVDFYVEVEEYEDCSEKIAILEEFLAKSIIKCVNENYTSPKREIIHMILQGYIDADIFRHLYGKGGGDVSRTKFQDLKIIRGTLSFTIQDLLFKDERCKIAHEKLNKLKSYRLSLVYKSTKNMPKSEINNEDYI